MKTNTRLYTDEERKIRHREAMKRYYKKNQAKIYAKEKERLQQKRQQKKKVKALPLFGFNDKEFNYG